MTSPVSWTNSWEMTSTTSWHSTVWRHASQRTSSDMLLQEDIFTCLEGRLLSSLSTDRLAKLFAVNAELLLGLAPF